MFKFVVVLLLVGAVLCVAPHHRSSAFADQVESVDRRVESTASQPTFATRDEAERHGYVPVRAALSTARACAACAAARTSKSASSTASCVCSRTARPCRAARFRARCTDRRGRRGPSSTTRRRSTRSFPTGTCPRSRRRPTRSRFSTSGTASSRRDNTAVLQPVLQWGNTPAGGGTSGAWPRGTCRARTGRSTRASSRPTSRTRRCAASTRTRAARGKSSPLTSSIRATTSRSNTRPSPPRTPSPTWCSRPTSSSSAPTTAGGLGQLHQHRHQRRRLGHAHLDAQNPKQHALQTSTPQPPLRTRFPSISTPRIESLFIFSSVDLKQIKIKFFFFVC